ncbi:hypothetical protein HaLaN_19147 [Haematococcus lacustris]|uniref:Helix-turn-helix domain-containing protein n=1 Tax=Haematococcus lacustris TaxID=44745 RepID=A0A699ZHR4_HAELA|nr:hypothetical protein HaLaN_19147 [Haematococcus lacustris]
MGRGTFDWLKRQLRPLIKTRRLSSGQRLAPTLRFLASGSSMLSVANELGMGHSTVHEAVHEWEKPGREKGENLNVIPPE